MSVAVSCNLPDGLILGVDSAVTLNDAKGNIAKVYETASKLFQLGEKPIGIGMRPQGVQWDMGACEWFSGAPAVHRRQEDHETTLTYRFEFSDLYRFF